MLFLFLTFFRIFFLFKSKQSTTTTIPPTEPLIYPHRHLSSSSHSHHHCHINPAPLLLLSVCLSVSASVSVSLSLPAPSTINQPMPSSNQTFGNPFIHSILHRFFFVHDHSYVISSHPIIIPRLHNHLTFALFVILNTKA